MYIETLTDTEHLKGKDNLRNQQVRKKDKSCGDGARSKRLQQNMFYQKFYRKEVEFAVVYFGEVRI